MVIPMTQITLLRGQVNVDNRNFNNYLFDCVDETTGGHGNCFMIVEFMFCGDGLGSPDVTGPENDTDLLKTLIDDILEPPFVSLGKMELVYKTR